MQQVLGVFDILGPVMIGPSSSHTAGASRIGFMSRQILDAEPTKISLFLYGTMGKNYRECNNHTALVGGLLGWKADDLRLSDAISIAQKGGTQVDWTVLDDPIDHPNTVRIMAISKEGLKVEVTGVSLGAGKIHIKDINGHIVNMADDKQGLLLIVDSKGQKKALGLLSEQGVDIQKAQESTNVDEHLLLADTNQPVAQDLIKDLRSIPGVRLASRLLPIDRRVVKDVGPIESIQAIVETAELKKGSLAEMFLQREMSRLGLSREELIADMREIVVVMRNSTERGLKGHLPSIQNLMGNDARKMDVSRRKRGAFFGDTLAKVVARAMGVVEVCGSLTAPVVAAPTGGASGTVPGVVITIGEELKISDDVIAMALFSAGGVGIIMAQKIGLSGSVGGCQAECGAASAIAAAAAAQMVGGSPSQVVNAAAIALKNHLGQVCDTIVGVRGGIPCVKRNATSAAVALVGAEMALAGIESAVPFDEVAEALATIGVGLPDDFKGRRTSGLADTLTGRTIQKRFNEETQV
ncbi:L-serine ammonia-lyase, iron-sulfur-dependent, subunit alpha [Chloroflexota bacterium]